MKDNARRALVDSETFATLKADSHRFDQAAAAVREAVLNLSKDDLRLALKTSFQGMKAEDTPIVQLISGIAYLRIREILEEEADRLHSEGGYIDDV